MNKENRFPAIALLALIWGAGLQGCASAGTSVPPAEPSRAASPTSKPAAASKDTVTVENLLRWPLEGVTGLDRVVSGIEATFDPSDGTAKSLKFTKQEFRLKDGYLLTYRSVFSGPGARVGLAQEPCFPPSRAAEIIGAQPGPVVYDFEEMDLGRIYRVIRNGIRMHVYTTPITYQCVAQIDIYTLPKLANTSIELRDVTLEHLLRWPLEGESGMDKVEAGLHQVFQDMEPLPNQQFSSSGVAYLFDGTVLSSAWISKGQFDIGLKNVVCISPEPYAELIGAQGSVIPDAHGVDRGKTYSVKKNGVMVRISTTPITYQCITSIHIHQLRKKSVP